MRFRLASVNAASGRDWGTGRHDVAAWAAAAATLDADVVGVQEVDHLLPRSGAVDQTAALAAALGVVDPTRARFLPTVHGTPGTPDWRPTRPGEPEGPSYGVALVSRHPVEAWHERRVRGSRLRLPLVVGPGGVMWVPDEPRGALAATLRTPEGPVTVVSTHLSFSPPRAVAQLREITTWAASLPGPVVLLGDLNLPGPVPAAVSGWESAAQHATFPAGRPRVQLDHVLLAPTAPGAPAPRVVASAAEVVGGSDHRSLVVDLTVGAGD